MTGLNIPDAGTSDVATPGAAGTVALFHFDGTQGSTSPLDSSGTGKVATITGNPIISTAQSKFGGASLYVNGNGSAQTNYVTISHNTDFAFPGDFTMDWWQNVVSYTDTWGGFVSAYNGNYLDSGHVTMGWNTGGTGIHFAPPVGTTQFTDSPSVNTWHHVALTRDGQVFRTFIDGVLRYQYTDAAPLGGSLLRITGTAANGDNGDFNGYIDELRVVKGTAVWTSNFTPPVAPYSDGTGVSPDGGATDAATSIPDAAVPTPDGNSAVATGLWGLVDVTGYIGQPQQRIRCSCVSKNGTCPPYALGPRRLRPCPGRAPGIGARALHHPRAGPAAHGQDGRHGRRSHGSRPHAVEPGGFAGFRSHAGPVRPSVGLR